MKESGYKLLRNSNGRGATISVPAAWAEHIPTNVVFDPELTEDGILFRARTTSQKAPEPELPAWTQPSRPGEGER